MFRYNRMRRVRSRQRYMHVALNEVGVRDRAFQWPSFCQLPGFRDFAQ